MWLRENRLKRKTAHVRLPSASQKRAYLSSLICHSPTLRASVLYKQSILCIFFNFSLFVLFQNKQNHKIVFGYSVVDVFSTELFGSESSLLYEY